MNEILRVIGSILLIFCAFLIWVVTIVGGTVLGLMYSQWIHLLTLIVGFIISFILLRYSFKCLFYYQPWTYIKSKIMNLHNLIWK
jgi:hypothetical protein